MPQAKITHNQASIRTSRSLLLPLLLILCFAAPIFGEKIFRVNWGVNQLAYLPIGLHYLWILLAAALIGLIMARPGRQYLGDLLIKYLWGGKKRWGRIIIPSALVLLFLAFRFEAHLYGNGYMRVGNLAQKTKPIFRWFEYGSTLIPYFFYYIIQLVGVVKESAAFWSYQIISMLSGVPFWVLTLRISEHITADNKQRLIFLGMILFSGLSLFFFGMVENAPLLLPASALFVLLLLKSHQAPAAKNLFYLWGVLCLGVFLDVTFLAAFPAAIYATVHFVLKKNPRAEFIALTAAILAAVIGTAVLYILAAGDIAVENRILLLNAKSPELDYSLFSKHHLTDILNLLFLLIPLFPIFIFFIASGWKELRKNREFLSLALLTAGQLILLFTIDPRNGMARDINLYAFPLLGLVFWGAYASAKNPVMQSISQKITSRLIPAALLLVIPAFIVHLGPEKTVAYLDHYLTQNEGKYESALYAFRDYYYVAKNFTEADRREQSITGKVKSALESQLVNDLYFRERVDDAFAYANRLVERDPYNATYRMQRANLLRHFKKFAEAENEYKTALILDPYRTDLHHFLAELYRDMKREEDCYRILIKAAAFDPKSSLILIDLAGYYFRSGSYAATDSLADLAMAMDPEKPYPYLYKGLVADRRGTLPTAYDFYGKFVKNGEGLPELAPVRKRMNEIFLKMSDTTLNR